MEIAIDGPTSSHPNVLLDSLILQLSGEIAYHVVAARAFLRKPAHRRVGSRDPPLEPTHHSLGFRLVLHDHDFVAVKQQLW